MVLRPVIPGEGDCVRGIGYTNEPYQECPNVMFSVGWNEDIDLNAAAGALATLLGQAPNFRQGADELLLPYACYLKRLWYCDETVAGAGGGVLVVDKGLADRQLTLWRQNALQVGDNSIQMAEWPGLGQLLPKGSVLSLTAGQSGSGAEQHTCILDMHAPGFRPSAYVRGDVEDPDGLFVDYSLLSGTLVADTLSGGNDILAHIADYQDSEPAFGVDRDRLYTVYALTNAPGGAGYGVCGFRHPSADFYFLRPAIFASAVSGYKFPMDQPWRFNGDDRVAPRLVAAGVGTTSTEFQPHMVAHGRM